jgi:ubiquinone/menaquinone biosynthesis C-methylase UbiE
MKPSYHPEKYWTEVGERIASREEGNVIAGDDEPYYRYKRERFLDLLKAIDFKNKSVLEIGCGPGGNLSEILPYQPKQLVGVDISAQMVALAKKNLPSAIEVLKINGTELPFKDKQFDIVFTATVLQHNTDEVMLKKLMNELCRVSNNQVFILERIEEEIKGDELCHGRPISYYSEIMKQNGFTFQSQKFINIRASYYMAGVIRKGLNPRSRQEGEPLNGISVGLQNLLLPITAQADKVFTSNKDIARLEYIRKNS